MKTIIRSSLIGLVAVFTVSGATQASETGVMLRLSDYHEVGGFDRFDHHRFDGPHHRGRWREGRDWHRYYGRPVPGWGQPRPVFGRPGWRRFDDCRVIVRRHVNRWGERVVRRIKICD